MPDLIQSLTGLSEDQVRVDLDEIRRKRARRAFEARHKAELVGRWVREALRSAGETP